MDTEADAAIISDDHDKCGLSDCRRVSNERVQDFLSWRANNPRQMLADSIGLSALFDILAWHAALPFPPACTASGPLIDEGAFPYAILLTRDPALSYGPTFSALVHGLYSGSWGPHCGWLLAARGKDARDWRRRLFRSLAEPAESEEAAGKLTTVSALSFFMCQRREGGARESDEDEPDQQVVVMVDEDERSIDLRDILSEYPPESDPLTANPLRDSYKLALDALPCQPHDLAELSVPITKLVSLLRLLHVSNEEASRAGLMALANRLGGEPSQIGWQRFDAVLSSQTARR
ncbi:hypothetical protein MMYC01_207032 [Madurella mycetomatis]|uniref:Uncharacterized protein n=1 Tax=Madurella mycetomatis TaxID=100816 RepID=A0A175W2T2_9PEZI|nr:hypothetical protein MMYC01_207032 [Madurella mycetomatis]